MRALLRSSPLALAPWLVLAACHPATDDAAGDTTDDTPDGAVPKSYPAEVGGKRAAQVIRPADFEEGEVLPVVVLLHGYSSWGEDTDIIFHLAKRVDTDRFLLVMPDGKKDAVGNQFWNATDDCCNWFGAKVDDVAYLSGLVAELRAGYDVGEVAVVGHSNGAYMAYRLACDAPEAVDRLVTVAGAVPLDEPTCAGGKDIPLLHLHGTYDEVIGYDRYDGSFGGVATVGAVETVRRYAARAGCDATTHEVGVADLASSIRGDESSGVAYDGCPAPVALWSVDGGYHLFTDATEALRDGVAAFALGGDPTF
jgi:polyhydroxybutyrate depolymerase